MSKKLDIFNSVFESYKDSIWVSSNYEVELYYDILDGDNIVIGVKRIDKPTEYDIMSYWGGSHIVKGWKNEVVNNYCNELRILAKLIVDCASEIVEYDNGEDWGCNEWHFDSWDGDGDLIDGEDTFDGGDIGNINICKCVTCQIYR